MVVPRNLAEPVIQGRVRSRLQKSGLELDTGIPLEPHIPEVPWSVLQALVEGLKLDTHRDGSGGLRRSSRGGHQKLLFRPYPRVIALELWVWLSRGVKARDGTKTGGLSWSSR